MNKTYQDLVNVGERATDIGEFCCTAVKLFMSSREYREAVEGESYYNKHNITIENFQKFLYTMSGRKVRDLWSANYKLKTLFFRRLVLQQVQYVLGNGLILMDPENKKKLGRDFDFQLTTAAKRAMAAGRAFGFWNYDHLEVFGYADTPAQPGFCPLYDEETAELKGGIRFWFRTVGKDVLARYTLYEPDGYTEFRKKGSDTIEVLQEKQQYKITTTTSELAGVEAVTGENYGKLPIIPLYVNDSHDSELIGIRESIDAYDYIKSGMANDIDDTSGFYWILKNSGGMDDVDLAKFVQRMRTVKAATIDSDDDAAAEAHTLEVPVSARTAMLEILRRDIYEDFQALDTKQLSAAAKTTQEIQAAYQSQDNKCADFEYYVIDFVEQIMQLAGIEDTATFVWNRVVNQSEQTNMVLQAANYLPDETIVKHLPFLTPEEADEIIATREQANMQQFGTGNGDE